MRTVVTGRSGRGGPCGPGTDTGHAPGTRAARADVERGGGHRGCASRSASEGAGGGVTFSGQPITQKDLPMKIGLGKGTFNASIVEASFDTRLRTGVARPGWRLRCPRTNPMRRRAAMLSTTRGRVTVRHVALTTKRPCFFLALCFCKCIRAISRFNPSVPDPPLTLPCFFFSPGISVDAVLPLRRARHVRRAVEGYLGVHGQEQKVREALIGNICVQVFFPLDTEHFNSLPQQRRPGLKRQGSGECSGSTGTRETVLDPDGPERSGEALAETVRRQGAGRRVGGWRDKNFWVVTTKLISRKKATTKGTTHKYMRLLASYLAPLRAAHKNFFRTTSTSSTSTMATESHPETHPHQVHHDYT